MCEVMFIQGETFFSAQRADLSKTCLFENSEYDLNLDYLCCLTPPSKPCVLRKILMIKATAPIWRENMLGYLSWDIIYSSKLTVFQQLRSRKTVRFTEQIISEHKFPRQLEATVYIFVLAFENDPKGERGGGNSYRFYYKQI